MKRLGVTAILGLASLVGACGGSAEVRYKVIVDIDDNGRERSGSSVWSWTVSKPTIALASPYDAKFKGEAIEVDLGGGRRLYALLRGEDNNGGLVQMWPERLFEDLGAGFSDRVKSIRQIASNKGAERVLPRWVPPISRSRDWSTQYPMLVRFSEPDDPTSLKVVDPEALDKSFGSGVSLKAIRIQITDEPVAIGIKTRLPWLVTVGKTRSTLIPNPPQLMVDAAPVQLIGPSAFSTELYK